MKKGLIIAAFLVLLILPAASYAIQVGDYIRSDAPSYNNLSTGGGEFEIRYYSPTKTGGPLFLTFCVQSETFNLGEKILVAGISTQIMTGGTSNPSYVPLAQKAAFLYYYFATNSLPDYNYAPGTGRDASEDMLQRAIWYYVGVSGGSTNLFTAWADAHFNWEDNDYHNVRVMNLVDGDYPGSQGKQDFLTLVPEPATLLLMGLGLIGLAGLRRKE